MGFRATPDTAGLPAINGTSRENAVSFIRDPGSIIQDPSSQAGVPFPHGPVQRFFRAHLPKECALHGLAEDLEQLPLVGDDHGEIASILQLPDGDRPRLPLRTGSRLPEVGIGGRLLWEGKITVSFENASWFSSFVT